MTAKKSGAVDAAARPGARGDLPLPASEALAGQARPAAEGFAASVALSAVGMGLAMQSATHAGEAALQVTPAADPLDAPDPEDGASAQNGVEAAPDTAARPAGPASDLPEPAGPPQVAVAEPALAPALAPTPLLAFAPPLGSEEPQGAGDAPVRFAANTTLPPPELSLAAAAAATFPGGTVSGVVGGLLDQVTGDGGLVETVLGEGGVVDNLLDPLLGDGGLIDTVLDPLLGDDGVVGVVLDPVLGDEGLVDTLLGEGGVADSLLDPLLGDGAPLETVLDPVLGDDGLVGAVLDPLLGDDGPVEPVLAPVLGAGGIVGAVTDPLLGPEGLVGDVIGAGGALDPLLDGPVGGLVDALLGRDRSPGSGAGTEIADSGAEAFDDGFVESLLGDGVVMAGADSHASLAELLGGSSDQLLARLLGDDGMSDAALQEAASGGDDLLGEMLGLQLTGALATGELLGAPAGAEDSPDPEPDLLLSEILDSGERMIGGVTEPLSELLDTGAEEGSGGLFGLDLQPQIEGALETLFGSAGGEAGPSADDGGLLGGLRLTGEDESV